MFEPRRSPRIVHYYSSPRPGPMSEITNFRGETLAADSETRGEAAARALILRVGERVRKARELKGIPRRVLSEASGVSPRKARGSGRLSMRIAMANTIQSRTGTLRNIST